LAICWIRRPTLLIAELSPHQLLLGLSDDGDAAMVLQGVGRYGGIKVYAVLREDGAEFAKNNNLEALFHVDDPGPRCPIKKGKFLDVNEALEVVRFDIQYCDWRARQDLLTIMLLHNKVP
jgi:hypothetical protein